MDELNRPLHPEADPGPTKGKPALVRAGGLVAAHFAAYRRMGKRPFFWRMSVEGLVVPLVLGGALSTILDLPSRTDLDGLSVKMLAFAGVVAAPVVETLLFQALPIMLVRRAGGGFWMQAGVSIAAFAAIHFPSGAATGITAGLLSGFYLAFAYAHWRQESFRSAFWMTAGMHALHNFMALIVTVISRMRG